MKASAELVTWLASGRRGMSSNALATYLTGIECRHPSDRDAWDHPHDPDDMARCRKLLDSVGVIRLLFPGMGSASPEWAVLVEHWQELCDLMDEESPQWREGRGSARKTYDRMRLLLDGARKHGGAVT